MNINELSSKIIGAAVEVHKMLVCSTYFTTKARRTGGTEVGCRTSDVRGQGHDWDSVADS